MGPTDQEQYEGEGKRGMGAEWGLPKENYNRKPYRIGCVTTTLPKAPAAMAVTLACTLVLSQETLRDEIPGRS